MSLSSAALSSLSSPSPEYDSERDDNCENKGTRHGQPVQDEPREEGQRSSEIFINNTSKTDTALRGAISEWNGMDGCLGGVK